MKFNLNDNSLTGGNSVVFNSGNAGKVEGVKIEVTKRRSDEPETYPNYKLVISDKNGTQLNQGFFYHKDNSQYSAEKNEQNAGYLVSRILSVAKAVVPTDFVFPDVEGKSANEVVDILFQIIREHSSTSNVNVFTTYGTKDRPSKFLGLRFFDFIERGDNTGYSRLIPKGNDLMEKLVEDTPKTEGGDTKPSGNNDSGWGM